METGQERLEYFYRNIINVSIPGKAKRSPVIQVEEIRNLAVEDTEEKQDMEIRKNNTAF